MFINFHIYEKVNTSNELYEIYKNSNVQQVYVANKHTNAKLYILENLYLLQN